MGKIFERISFYLLLAFGLAGCVFLSLVLHEYSHYLDYHQYVEEDSICALVLPLNWSYVVDGDSAAAYYTYDYDYDNETIVDKINKIDKHTETRAYIITNLVFILFLFVAGNQLLKRLFPKDLNTLNNLNYYENPKFPDDL